MHVRVEARTATGLFGVDERTVHVLPPVEYRSTSNVGPSTCAALCGTLACTACEIGVARSGYLRGGDASTTIGSCSETFELEPLRRLGCCCCR